MSETVTGTVGFFLTTERGAFGFVIFLMASIAKIAANISTCMVLHSDVPASARSRPAIAVPDKHRRRWNS